MSKIALSGPASGTATYTVTAPTGATDRTITLPDVSATLITDSAGVLNIGSGQIYKDASGNLLVNSTTNFSTSSKQFLKFDEQAQVGLTLQSTNATTGGSYVYFVNSAGSVAGYIQHSGSTTVAYTTSSDYRLKENVQPMQGALATVSQLKPCTYTWKEDGSDGQGFIAHELQAVIPDAVAGEKDAVNEDGSIKPQGIDTSFLVATLTAAIQEQQAIITALTARVEALEGTQP